MNRRIAPILVSAFATVALSGCEGTAPGAQEPLESTEFRTVWDSAGVRIIENRAPEWVVPWRVDGTTTLEIPAPDRSEGDPETRIVDALRLSDGRLLVADGGARELRWYTAEGALLQRQPGGGDDPFEFGSISGLIPLPGDSVAAYDPGLRRAAIFGPDGTLAGTEPLSEFSVALAPVARFSDGSYLIGGRSGVMSLGAQGPAGVSRPPLEVIRLQPGGLPTALVTLPGTEIGVREDALTSTGFVHEPRVPFGRSTFVVRSPEGWLSADNTRYQFEVRTDAGGIVRVVRRPHEPVPVRTEDRGAVLAEYPTALLRQQIRAVWEGWSNMPETMPAFSEVKVDPDGRVWLRDFNPPGIELNRWSVFAPDGGWLGDVDVPPGVRVIAVEAEGILAVRDDPDEGEVLVLHRILRP